MFPVTIQRISCMSDP